MGHKGNSHTKKALEEDGDQKDWPAADPVEEEGGHSWYLERPHGMRWGRAWRDTQ